MHHSRDPPAMQGGLNARSLDDENDTVRFNASAAVVKLSASGGVPARW
jgi:hypothetical protein